MEQESTFLGFLECLFCSAVLLRELQIKPRLNASWLRRRPIVWEFVSWNKKNFLHVSRTPRRPKLTYNFYLTGTWAWDCCENHVNSLGETLAWEKEARIVSSFTRRHMWYSNQIYNFFLKYVSYFYDYFYFIFLQLHIFQ